MTTPLTLADLDQFDLVDCVKQIHIIVGANGMCLCGIYDGMPRTCADILRNKSEDIQKALVMANCGMERWKKTPQ